MKNRTVKFLLLSLFNFLMLPFSQGQISEFTRGHNPDDLYVFCTPLKTINLPLYLIHISDYGKSFSIVNKDAHSCWDLTADPIPGNIIGHSDMTTCLSMDYGKTFNYSYPFIYCWHSIMEIYGGNIPGELLYMVYDVAIWPSPMVMLFKTSDYGISFNQLAVDVPPIINGENGSISGEIYQMPILNGHAYLCHSLDFGVSYDSISIDTTIINENAGLNFFKLSHCTQQGELFLVNKSADSTYKIYHTIDYGNNWELKNTLSFNSDFQLATAGRADCSFYFANFEETPNSDYFTLHILYSGDCGETFTTYDYPLSNEVEVNDYKSKYIQQLSINPNPVYNQTSIIWHSNKPVNAFLHLYNPTGSLVYEDQIISDKSGVINHQLNLAQLSVGIYILKLESENSTIASGKLVIVR